MSEHVSVKNKERCDSKPVVLEEWVVLHSVSLREGADQRGVDPRIWSMERRLSPEALWLQESVQVSLCHPEPWKGTVQTLPKPSYAASPRPPGISKCFINQIHQEKVSAIQIFILSDITEKYNG